MEVASVAASSALERGVAVVLVPPAGVRPVRHWTLSMWMVR